MATTGATVNGHYGKILYKGENAKVVLFKTSIITSPLSHFTPWNALFL
jgi:hypothetical protein